MTWRRCKIIARSDCSSCSRREASSWAITRPRRRGTTRWHSSRPPKGEGNTLFTLRDAEAHRTQFSLSVVLPSSFDSALKAISGIYLLGHLEAVLQRLVVSCSAMAASPSQVVCLTLLSLMIWTTATGETPSLSWGGCSQRWTGRPTTPHRIQRTHSHSCLRGWFYVVH